MDICTIRRDLHQIPELGRKEYKTKQYLLDFGKRLNCRVLEVAATGVVFVFDVGRQHTLCFRADMDALPIGEKTGLSYASRHPGLMHACGHDGHMAMLLGFAEWASSHRFELQNNIVCLFQPSEEDNAGANDILKSGILEELGVEQIFGMHIWPTLKENTLFTMPGGMLATSGEVDIVIHGRSCHAANRSEGIDALLTAAQLVQQFYAIGEGISKPHLISFGRLEAGTVRNAVADTAYLQATMRAFDDATFTLLTQELKQLIFRLEQQTGVRIELSINAAYPSILNDEMLVNKYRDLLSLHILEKPFLQAEDFGCYTRRYRCLFMLLGCGNQALLHTADFNFNEEILFTGCEAYKKIACCK